MNKNNIIICSLVIDARLYISCSLPRDDRRWVSAFDQIVAVRERAPYYKADQIVVRPTNTLHEYTYRRVKSAHKMFQNNHASPRRQVKTKAIFCSKPSMKLSTGRNNIYCLNAFVVPNCSFSVHLMAQAKQT